MKEFQVIYVDILPPTVSFGCGLGLGLTDSFTKNIVGKGVKE